MRKSIVFTKLGTVKTDVFEHSIDSFFQLMHNAITQDVLNNFVYYSEENNCFEVVYDRTTYQVYQGSIKVSKDSEFTKTIEMLEKLTNLSTKTREDFEIEKEEKKKKKENDKKVIANGKKGIFNSDEDKLIYINYLKETYNADKEDIKKRIGDLLKGIACCLGCAGGTAAFFIFLEELAAISIAFIVLFPMFAILAAGNASILWAYHKKRKNIKKKIQSIQKSLGKDNEKELDYFLVNSKQEEKEAIKITNPVLKSVSEISKEFRKVQGRINQVLSDVKQKEFSSELLSILDNYKREIAESSEKGNHMIIYKNAINELISLAHRVSETIRKEEQEKKNKEEFGIMFDEIGKVEARTNK
jgi:ParB-like chromosome segregation protein Spo0J